MFSTIIGLFSSGINSFRKFLKNQREEIEKKEKTNIQKREAKRLELEDIQKQCNKETLGTDKLSNAEKRIIAQASKSKKDLPKRTGIDSAKSSFYKMKAATKAIIQSKLVTRVLALRSQELGLFTVYILLEILKYLVMLIEQIVILLVSVLGVVGVIIIVAFLLVFLVIMALDNTDNIDDNWNSVDNSDCVEGGEVIENSNWDFNSMGALNSTFTPYQQNLYKTFVLVNEFLKSDGINKPYLNELPINVAFKVYRGIPAVESGYTLFGKSDISKDVLKDLIGVGESDEYIGPHQISKSATIDYTEYYKFWNGKSFVDSWKLKYVKPTADSDQFWMPYSVGMSLMHTLNMGTYGTLNTNSSNYSEFKSYVETAMDHFGIKKNREECFQYIRAFLSLSCYLQGQGMSFLNYESDGGGKARIDYFCALFAASSTDDNKRSFENYSIILNSDTKYNYAEGEGGLREWLIGNQGYISGIDLGNLTFGDKKPRIKVENVELTVPLMQYVYDKYKDDVYMTNCWSHIKSVGGQFLSSYHYGLACLLQGNHIVDEFGTSAPVSSGGNSEDCDCVEGNGSSNNSLSLDISNIKMGEAQGPWNTELKNKIMDRVSTKTGEKFSKYFGNLFIGDDSDSSLENWRRNSKWKVPYYLQSNSANIIFSSNGLRYDTSGGSLNACGTYMLAYLMSASTGKLINPIEAFAVGLELGIFQTTGGMAYQDFNKLEEYGIFITHIEGKNNVTNKEKVDKCLANGGLVGVRSTNPANIFVSSEHFFVITEKVGDKYNVYASTGFLRDTKQSYTWEEVTLGLTRFFLTDVKGNKNNTATAKKTTDIPENLGTYFTYEAWQANTAANQGEFRAATGTPFNEDGMGVVNGRFVIACAETYGITDGRHHIGDYIDFYQSDGTVIPCVIGDIKSSGDAGYSKWGHDNGKNIIEFCVDVEKWYTPEMKFKYGFWEVNSDGTKGKELFGKASKAHANVAQEGFMMQYAGKSIVKAVCLGNYFEDPNFGGTSNDKDYKDCTPRNENTIIADNATTNINDLPGGVVRSFSVKKNSKKHVGTFYEPDAPIWNGSDETNPYETSEYEYVYDKKTGYRLGMWPKNANLNPISVSKTYNGLIWPCDSSIQGTGYEHEGADLHGKCYTPIYAPADGKIVSSEWGNTDNIDLHESAYCINFLLDNPVTYNGKTIKLLWLGHMTGIRYRVSSGDTPISVKQGDLIGWMGYANAVHLHLTLDYQANIYTSEFDKFYQIPRGSDRKAGQ